MENFKIPTIVKWAGGKKQLIEQLKEFFPEKIDRYFEPFVGGGAVLFYVLQNFNPKETVISDINEELINCYKVIKYNVEDLILKLQFHRKHHSKDYYYNIRELKPEILSDIERASRTIYLNKTCFNGLYRVNSRGQFNVPIGSYKNPQIFSEQELRFISKLLKNVKIKVMSFEKILDFVKQEDFVYFDPPYYPLEKGKSFTSYTKEKFLEKEQEKLKEIFKELNKKRCNVMLSNSDTIFIKNLYKEFNINIVKANRMINCDATKRGKINEIIITNYLIQERLAPIILRN
ncbi:DNA adenine methylase [Candidatus Woesearchaeota archaeon]|nr:DNA adenine methylase [Candidatus Woesearchaeota archaeon]